MRRRGWAACSRQSTDGTRQPTSSPKVGPQANTKLQTNQNHIKHHTAASQRVHTRSLRKQRGERPVSTREAAGVARVNPRCGRSGGDSRPLPKVQVQRRVGVAESVQVVRG